MNCREFVEFLMRYLEDELPEEQATSFRQHLADCPPCETYLETYRETVRLGREVCQGETLPDDVPDALVDAILTARREG